MAERCAWRLRARNARRELLESRRFTRKGRDHGGRARRQVSLAPGRGPGGGARAVLSILVACGVAAATPLPSAAAALASPGTAGPGAVPGPADPPAPGPTAITDCTDDSQLQADAAAGGRYGFECSGTIQLTGPLIVTHDFFLDGGGNKVRIQGPLLTGSGPYCQTGYGNFQPLSACFRLFDVQGGHVSLSGLTLAGGVVTTVGATGTNGTTGPPPQDNASCGGDGTNGGPAGGAPPPAQGGGIFVGSGAFLTLVDDQFFNMVAKSIGGSGGTGGYGGDCGSGDTGGNGGNGGNGGPSGDAQGGAVYVSPGATLLAESVDFWSSTASTEGGGGGFGGLPGNSEYAGVAGNGGTGGDAGTALGGALFSAGTLTLVNVNFFNDSASSLGGMGGEGGNGPDETLCGRAGCDDFASPGSNGRVAGNGGDGGNGGTAEGGALYTTLASALACAAFDGDSVSSPSGYGGPEGVFPAQYPHPTYTGTPGAPGAPGTASGPDVVGPTVASGNCLVVTDSGDAPEAADASAGQCQSTQGTCTLRAAIQVADASGSPQTITFDIPGQAGMPQIRPASPLPAVTVPVTIDGTTQPGTVSGQPGIRLDGSGSSAGSAGAGLELDGADSVLRGLDVTGFGGDGVLLGGAGSSVVGSWLGVAPAGGGGYAAAGNGTGVEVAAANAVVGGTSPGAGDVISGNGSSAGLQQFEQGVQGKVQAGADLSQFGVGVLVRAGGTSGLRIQGDWIGPAPDGGDLAGGFSNLVGVLAVPGGPVTDVSIGGPGAAGNVISGDGIGVQVDGAGGGTLSGVTIEGNLIGPHPDGTASANDPSDGFGVLAAGPIAGLQIGAHGAGNTIQGDIIGLDVADTTGSSVQDNTIGTDAGAAGAYASPLGLHDLIGSILSDTVGATFAQNQVLGDAAGVALIGPNSGQNTVANNVIGRAEDIGIPFGSLQLDNEGAVIGLLLSGGHEQSVEANRFYDDAVGTLAIGSSQLTAQSNLYSTDGAGLVDANGAQDTVGGAGAGNTFLRGGFGLVLSSGYPDSQQAASAGAIGGVLDAAQLRQPFSQPGAQQEYGALGAVGGQTVGPGLVQVPAGTAGGDVMQGNWIGTDASGTPGEGNVVGALIDGAVSGALFGGTQPGEGNTVTGNGNAGLIIAGSPPLLDPAVGVLSNVFAGNGTNPEGASAVSGLGLDLATSSASGAPVPGEGLGPDQNTANPGQGANGLQNYPVLTSAGVSGGELQVQGTLTSAPDAPYVVQLFASAACNPSGYGEGQQLLGTVDVTTDAQGSAPVDLTVPPPAGSFLTATATGGTAVAPVATSEFSPCLQVGGPAIISLSPTSSGPGGGGTVTITGSGFGGGDTVWFYPAHGQGAGAAATDVQVASGTQITATIPAETPDMGAAGAQAVVEVCAPAGGSSPTCSNKEPFTYGLQIVALSPASSGPGGGGTVTITGSGFGGGDTVWFYPAQGQGSGAAATDVQVLSDGEITATIPASTPDMAAGGGQAVVEVCAAAGGSSPICSNQEPFAYGFAYKLDITSLSPTSSGPGGGDTVTIAGSGFAAGNTVWFYPAQGHGTGAAATNVEVASGTQITATIPAETRDIAAGGGLAAVEVCVPGGGSPPPCSNQEPFAYAPVAGLGAPLPFVYDSITGLTLSTLPGLAPGSSLSVPPGALPAGTTIDVYPVDDGPALQEQLPPGQSYVAGVAVTWLDPNGLSPMAGEPIRLTIAAAAIRPGDAVYVVTPSGPQPQQAVVSNGQAVVTFSQDPVFVVGQPASQGSVPTLDTLTPASGPVGVALTLSGSGFGTVPGSVYFTQGATQVLRPSSLWTDVEVAASVPPGLAPGSVSVAVYNAATGLLSSSLPFAVSGAVTLALGPASVIAGGQTTVSGAVYGASGTPVVGTTVTLSDGGRGGRFDDPAPVTTAGGAFRATYTAPETPGTVTVTAASAGTAPPASGVLTVLNPGVSVSATSTAGTSSGGTPATAGGGNSPTPETTATATGGTGSVTVENYSGDPGPAPAFRVAGGYFDVSVAPGSTFAAVTVIECEVAATDTLDWLDGTTWVPVSPPAGFDGATGCLTFIARTIGTAPAVADLTGTPFVPLAPAVGLPAAVVGAVAAAPAPPIVTATIPAMGPAPGGTAVQIVGRGFTGADAVRFGLTPAMSFQVESDTQVAAVAPPGQGSVDVTVTGPEGTSAANPGDRFAYAPAAPTFADVPPAYWAAGAIGSLAAAGAVQGFRDGTFRPDAPVTRAEFVKMLALTLHLPAVAPGEPFADVPTGAWYAPYVSAAVHAGIVRGTSPTTFGPDASLTREQMGVLLARALRLSATVPLPFADAAQVDTWAVAGIGEAVAAGYLTGFPDGTFRPLAGATRAQAAKVLAAVLAARTGHTAGAPTP